MHRSEGGETLLYGDLGDTSVVEAPKIHFGDIVCNRLALAAEFVERGISDNPEHPRAIGWRVVRDLTGGKGPGRCLLHEIASGIGIAQHGAGECKEPREQTGKAFVLCVRHVRTLGPSGNLTIGDAPEAMAAVGP